MQLRLYRVLYDTRIKVHGYSRGDIKAGRLFELKRRKVQEENVKCRRLALSRTPIIRVELLSFLNSRKTHEYDVDSRNELREARIVFQMRRFDRSSRSSFAGRIKEQLRRDYPLERSETSHSAKGNSVRSLLHSPTFSAKFISITIQLSPP